LTEEHRQKVSFKSLLRKIMGAKNDMVHGDGKELHSEKLHYFFSSPNIYRI
jgi:hypothetical protein